MKIHFYGTGASEGVPAIFCQCENCKKIRKMGGNNYRSRTSSQIDDDLMIDFSADVFDHMRYGNLDMSKIKNLIITHTHTDHFYPEELMHIAEPYAFGVGKRELHVYGNREVCKRLEQVGAKYIQENLKITEIHNFQELQIGNYRVKALPAEHDHTQECHLYIVRKDGKNLLYAHDTGYFPEETWKAIEKEYFSGVVLDCTCCAGPSYFESHMSLEDDVRVQKRMMETGSADQKTVFIATHFVHTYGPFQDVLETACKPYHFLAAYDGMEAEI